MSRFLPSRRKVLIGGGVLGLLIGVGAWTATRKGPSLAGTADAEGVFLHDWIHVGRDGLVTLRAGQSEMGQGAFTGIATLVAEELGCRLDQMKVETGPASDVFKNIAGGRDGLLPNHGLAKGPPEGFGGAIVNFVAEAATMQITGGSSTIMDRFDRARSAGAAAREMLIQAAAKQWGAARGECSVKDGAVVHASGKSLGFGALAEAAAKETPPASIALKPRSEWKLIGAAKTARVDVPAKVDGSAQYGIDVRRPGMLFAAVMNSPGFGGSVKRIDDAAAKAMRGVVKIVTLPSAVAVVAETTWRAKAALEKLKVEWDSGAAASLDSAEITKSLAMALGGASKIEAEGDFAAAYGTAAKKLSADYSFPYLSHAPMEPMNCTAEVSADRVEIWAPTQAQTITVAECAAAAGVSKDKVTLHTTLMGGGFGRRLETDFAVQAVQVAKAVGKPVQVIWSREEDIQHDFYRPAAIMRMEGGLDAGNKPTALRFATSVQASVLARLFPPITWLGPDDTQFEGTVGLPYAIPNRRSDLARISTAVPIGSWRSVGHSITSFAKESFIDEMAQAAGADPVAFRLAMLGEQPRLTALLKLVAEKSGWGQPMKPGQGRGVAIHTSFASACAQVVEVTVGDKGAIKVDRVVAAVDCGTVVNPDIVRAQVESAIIYGLSAALFGKITIKNGRVEQSNFPDYDVVHMAQAPRIEVYISASGAPPGGIGEPGLPPVAPALGNAVFAATGKRVRSLPFMDQGFEA